LASLHVTVASGDGLSISFSLSLMRLDSSFDKNYLRGRQQVRGGGLMSLRQVYVAGFVRTPFSRMLRLRGGDWGRDGLCLAEDGAAIVLQRV